MMRTHAHQAVPGTRPAWDPQRWGGGGVSKHQCADLHGMDMTLTNGRIPHLSCESTVESEPDLGHETSKGLVEEVAEELADAEICPATVDEQEALEVGELCQGVVAALHGLHALQPADAHPDVSGCRGQEGVKRS